jgi:hypothetical protein
MKCLTVCMLRLTGQTVTMQLIGSERSVVRGDLAGKRGSWRTSVVVSRTRVACSELGEAQVDPCG